MATAAYGSFDCPEVWTLRRYRDNHLAKSPLGKAFIHVYDSLSPTFAKLLGKQDGSILYFIVIQIKRLRN